MVFPTDEEIENPLERDNSCRDPPGNGGFPGPKN